MALEDLQATTDSLEKMSIFGLEPQSSVATPPQPNFPLPREIRDIIYEYLLSYEHVREKPYHTRTAAARGKCSENNARSLSYAHTYKFHTNIININRQIYEEATRVLNLNSFITVSTLWLEFSALAHSLGVPIVTENQSHVAKFERNVLRVHFQRPPRVKDREETIQSFIMVAADLPKFCTCIRSLHGILPSPALHIGHTKGDPPQVFHQAPSVIGPPKKYLPSLKIRIERVEDTPKGHLSIRQLLEPFRVVAFGMQNVKFMNVSNALMPYTEHLQLCMSPKTVWTNALAWNWLEIARELTQEADALVLVDDLTGAGSSYPKIWRMSEVCPIFHIPISLLNEEAKTFVLEFDLLLLVCAITDGLLSISCKDFIIDMATKRNQAINNMIMHMQSIPGGQEASADWVGTIVNWNVYLMGFFLSRGESDPGPVLEKMEELRDETTGPLKAYFAHDAKVVEDCINCPESRAMYRRTDQSALKLLCERLSVSQLGIPSLDSGLSRAAKPSHIQGLVDQAHYEALAAVDPELAATLR